ncbi:terpene synthase family, metal binding domain-containing protein [Rhizoctonia solani AG-1 IA]|uniref:Terpene synthase family, metal binding domain-containing protein n=1 Tax=Thanatephorus cucumeris (strain AG1-IA) TaxID=983506 RepID=L8WLE7_THACA|nr:terpene synthase family, metal binding domain-containing protein [Rhizoctonia solani AG-1 IA]
MMWSATCPGVGAYSRILADVISQKLGNSLLSSLLLDSLVAVQLSTDYSKSLRSYYPRATETLIYVNPNFGFQLILGTYSELLCETRGDRCEVPTKVWPGIDTDGQPIERYLRETAYKDVILKFRDTLQLKRIATTQGTTAADTRTRIGSPASDSHSIQAYGGEYMVWTSIASSVAWCQPDKITPDSLTWYAHLVKGRLDRALIISLRLMTSSVSDLWLELRSGDELEIILRMKPFPVVRDIISLRSNSPKHRGGEPGRHGVYDLQEKWRINQSISLRSRRSVIQGDGSLKKQRSAGWCLVLLHFGTSQLKIAFIDHPNSDSNQHALFEVKPDYSRTFRSKSETDNRPENLDVGKVAGVIPISALMSALMSDLMFASEFSLRHLMTGKSARTRLMRYTALHAKHYCQLYNLAEYMFPASQLIASTILPSQLSLPDVSAYTSKAFGSKTNPHQREAEIESYQWFDSYGISATTGIHTGTKRQRFFESGFGLMTAMCYPDCNFFDDMTDGGALDTVDGMKRAVDVTMKSLREPDSPPPKFKVAATVQHCYNRMRQDGNPAMLRRFVDALDFYTQACFQQKVNRSTDTIPTMEEYIQLRRDTSAMKIGFGGFFTCANGLDRRFAKFHLEAILEYTLDLDLPDQVADHPLVTELALIEFARGDTHNLVCVAMHHNSLDLAGAIDFANQLTRKRLDEYVEIKANLPSFGSGLDEQLARYLEGIEYCVQGTEGYFGAEAAQVKETGVVNIIAPITLDTPVIIESHGFCTREPRLGTFLTAGALRHLPDCMRQGLLTRPRSSLCFGDPPLLLPGTSRQIRQSTEAIPCPFRDSLYLRILATCMHDLQRYSPPAGTSNVASGRSAFVWSHLDSVFTYTQCGDDEPLARCASPTVYLTLPTHLAQSYFCSSRFVQ